MPSRLRTPTCSIRPDPMTTAQPRKKPAMNNNPFKPIPQRPERYDETWERRRDPIAYQAVREMARRGY